jgi:hypothetical protein
LRRSFIHEQLKTTNGTDIITIEQNEERRRRLTTPKRSARTGHANKESPLLSRLEEMSLISSLSKGGEFPALSSTLGHEATRTRSSSPSKACRDPNLVIKHGKDVLAWKALTCFPLSHPTATSPFTAKTNEPCHNEVPKAESISVPLPLSL